MRDLKRGRPATGAGKDVVLVDKVVFSFLAESPGAGALEGLVDGEDAADDGAEDGVDRPPNERVVVLTGWTTMVGIGEGPTEAGACWNTVENAGSKPGADLACLVAAGGASTGGRTGGVGFAATKPANRPAGEDDVL